MVTPEFSIVILTFNEEADIAACIESCKGADDIHVIDSYSTDSTVQMAKAYNCHVYQNSFTTFAQQRNWAIDNGQYKYMWHFHLDADERMNAKLVSELNEIVRGDTDLAGVFVPSRLMFHGRWLRRAGGYPTYQVRFFHGQRLRFEDHGHGQRELTTGRLAFGTAAYDHHNFSKGLNHWVEKHNRYSSDEATMIWAANTKGTGLAYLKSVIVGTRLSRRRALKAAIGRSWLRPYVHWVYIMVIRLGLLEGREARRYAQMMAMYERLILLKLFEIEKGTSGDD